MAELNILGNADGGKARVAFFLSGGGSNVREILKRHQAMGEASPMQPVALVTDRTEDPACGAQALGETFGIPVIGEDIRAFYRGRGTPLTLKTEAGRQVRQLWTQALRDKLSGVAIDFAVFGGFETLSNITGDFYCLNVHPGDLTYLKEGRRYLVGLHTVPIERAMLEGLTTLRSSVILALPYHGTGDDMDSGPILGISPEVSMDLQGHTAASLGQIAAMRPGKRPAGGYGDALEALARKNQDRLKEGGDWVVFPQVVFAVAQRRFGLDPENGVHFRTDEQSPFAPVTAPVFGE